MGSLGYLCNFKISDYTDILDMIFREKKSDEELKFSDSHHENEAFIFPWDRIVVNIENCKGREIHSQTFADNKKVEVIKNLHVMNEVVIERGPNSWFLTNIDLYVDNDFLTTV